MKPDFENFETWARTCARITDKLTGRAVPFVLNRPQRRVLAELEAMRTSGRPIRLIMLKARQWGGSTLIEAYMAWMQLVRRKGWNSLVCAHVKDAAAGIRATYSRLLAHYPEQFREGSEKQWALMPYEKSQSVSWIPARECVVAVASSQAPNSVRGSNFHMAHLSEVAFWGDGDQRAAEEIVRTVSGTIPLEADSLIVMESTANGTDNYFYREWRRAVEGHSDKRPIFVPWYEIDIYRTPPLSEAQRRQLMRQLDAYERELLETHALDAERIAWYHAKRREYPTHEAMMAEFPSTPEEAFASTKEALFPTSILPECEAEPTDIELSHSAQMYILTIDTPGRPAMLTLISRRMESIVAAHDCTLSGTVQEIVAQAGQATSRFAVPLAIIAASERAEGSAALAAAEALKRGVSLIYDDEEHPYLSAPRDLSGTADAMLRELLATHKIIETSPLALADYRNYRPERASYWPRILARMAAAKLLTRPQTNAPDLIEAALDAQVQFFAGWGA